jgi:hypothetical protein
VSVFAPTSISLRLPQKWVELDPRMPDIVAELRRAVGARWTSHELIAEDQLVSLLAPLGLELRRLSEAADIVLVGLYGDAVPIPGSADPLVLTAHAMLYLSPPLGSLDEVRTELGGGAQVVFLPAGQAVRSSGPVTVIHPDWDGSIEAFRCTYFVPIPGGSRMAVLSFLTPSTALTEEFADVFDAVARTLTFSLDD